MSVIERYRKNLRTLHRAGATLEQVLTHFPQVLHDGVTLLWAEIKNEKPRRKTPSYREAIEFIAMNDEPTIMDTDLLVGYPTVHLAAIMFGKNIDDVAADVVMFRTNKILGS